MPGIARHRSVILIPRRTALSRNLGPLEPVRIRQSWGINWAQIATMPTNNTIDVSDTASSTNVRNIFNAPLHRFCDTVLRSFLKRRTHLEHKKNNVLFSFCRQGGGSGSVWKVTPMVNPLRCKMLFRQPPCKTPGARGRQFAFNSIRSDRGNCRRHSREQYCAYRFGRKRGRRRFGFLTLSRELGLGSRYPIYGTWIRSDFDERNGRRGHAKSRNRQNSRPRIDPIANPALGNAGLFGHFGTVRARLRISSLRLSLSTRSSDG